MPRHARLRAMATAAALWCIAAPTPARALPAQSLFRQIDALIDAWQPEAALPLLDEYGERDGDDPLLKLAQARVWFNLGRYEDAVGAAAAYVEAVGSAGPVAEEVALIRTTAERTRAWVSQRSPRFEVFAAPGRDAMLIPFVLDTLEAALDAYVSDLGVAIPADALPLRVEIYPSVKDFVAVSTLTQREVETSGTIALCKFNRMMIVSPRRLARGYRWRDTLGHELVHFVLSRQTRNRLPLWLHEGIAKFEERRWASPELGRLHPIQASILSEARRKNVWVPFDQMMPSLAKLKDGWQTALAFAEVTLWVQRLVETDGLPQLRKVIAAFAEGDRAGYALLGVANERELWTRFLADVPNVPLNGVPGYRFIPPSVAEDPDAAESEPIQKQAAQKFTRLGDLLREEGHWAAAVTEYGKAEAELGYVPAPLSLKRAQALMLGGLYGRAAAELEDLLKRDPDRATAHFLLGKVALFRGDATAALSRFETAFGIAPFTNEVLDGLVDASERLGNDERLQAYANAREIFHATTP